jgi:hypothetical protein
MNMASVAVHYCKGPNSALSIDLRYGLIIHGNIGLALQTPLCPWLVLVLWHKGVRWGLAHHGVEADPIPPHLLSVMVIARQECTAGSVCCKEALSELVASIKLAVKVDNDL